MWCIWFMTSQGTMFLMGVHIWRLVCLTDLYWIFLYHYIFPLYISVRQGTLCLSVSHKHTYTNTPHNPVRLSLTIVKIDDSWVSGEAGVKICHKWSDILCSCQHSVNHISCIDEPWKVTQTHTIHVIFKIR